jgi:hypothetical protein
MATDVSQQQPFLAVLPNTCSSSANHHPLPTLPLLIYWDSSEAKKITYHGSSQSKAKHGKSTKLGFMLQASDTPSNHARTANCKVFSDHSKLVPRVFARIGKYRLSCSQGSIICHPFYSKIKILH